MTELIKPLPEKVGDYAGARVAAVAEYRAANPGVPMDEIRVNLASDGIHVYRVVTIGQTHCPVNPVFPDFQGGFDG